MKVLQMVYIQDPQGRIAWCVPCSSKKSALAKMRNFNETNSHYKAVYDPEKAFFQSLLINERYYK